MLDDPIVIGLALDLLGPQDCVQVAKRQFICGRRGRRAVLLSTAYIQIPDSDTRYQIQIPEPDSDTRYQIKLPDTR